MFQITPFTLLFFAVITLSCVAFYLLHFAVIFVGLTSAQLSIFSDGVDYTNDTFYAPYGTTVTLSCEGGSESKNWQIVSGIGALDIPTSGDTAQRTVGQIQELIIMNFGAATAGPYLCHDSGGMHPSVSVELSQGIHVKCVE